MHLGTGVGLGSPAPAPAASGSNPNLLLWSEAIDQAPWTLSNMSVGSDADGTADELTNTAFNGALRQTTTTAATAGAAAISTPTPTSSYVRYSVTGAFDGLDYTFSVEMKDAGGGELYTLRIDRSGGFLRCSVECLFADGDVFLRKLQLEQASSFTSYHLRGGT